MSLYFSNNLMRKTKVASVSVDGWLAALRLAKFCPTSLSIDDLRGITSKLENDSTAVQYIPPSPSVSSTEKAKVGIQSPTRSPRRNRFDFLLSDVKTEESPKQLSKMQYELSNMTKLRAPGKMGDSLMIVSLSSSNLSNETSKCSNDNLVNVALDSESTAESSSD